MRCDNKVPWPGVQRQSNYFKSWSGRTTISYGEHGQNSFIPKHAVTPPNCHAKLSESHNDANTCGGRLSPLACTRATYTRVNQGETADKACGTTHDGNRHPWKIYLAVFVISVSITITSDFLDVQIDAKYFCQHSKGCRIFPWLVFDSLQHYSRDVELVQAVEIFLVWLLHYLQVSVGGRDPPYLDPFHLPFLPHGDADVLVPVGVVTLGLRGAVGPAGTARVKPPRHQRNL